MIARILPLLLLLILLPDCYIHWHYLKRHKGYGTLNRILWWAPGLLMLAFTLVMASVPHFAPENQTITDCYLLLLGLLVIPKAAYALCSVAGLTVCRLMRSRQNYGNLVGFLLSLFLVYVALYSATIGPRRLSIREETFVSKDLPPSFDGYRIVQFTDAHVGSIPRGLLQRAVDSINAQRPDAIVFTGDLQNMQPRELDAVMPVLQQLQAKDGVFSVLGNHDYAFYLHTDFSTASLNEAMMCQKQHAMGWRLLLNEHAVVRRGQDSMVVAGMENESRKEEQTRGDIRKTMDGVRPGAFTVMLQHDPTAWERTILPQSEAQLTLSGHTHGGQFRFFGWSPAALSYKEWGGFYQENKRAINVSTGLGGFVPFRFGVTPEIVVITLRADR